MLEEADRDVGELEAVERAEGVDRDHLGDVIGPHGVLGLALLFLPCAALFVDLFPEGSLPVPEGNETTQMGYEFYPKGLEHVIRTVHEKLPIPLIVTENGVAAADDSRRIAYIEEALRGVERCVSDGIPVKGYCYWSLLDNFEWQKGFSMTFGLIAVNRATQERTPKESLRFLGNYAKNEV